MCSKNRQVFRNIFYVHASSSNSLMSFIYYSLLYAKKQVVEQEEHMIALENHNAELCDELAFLKEQCDKVSILQCVGL